VLSWYVVRDWREGCERCIQILRYGGMGHTMSIHSRNDEVILQFGLRKPAFRICVNTPTTHGSIGLTTGLDPAMTLGCGGWGGNITSDNISPRHLLNIKRVAYELRPAVDTGRVKASEVTADAADLPKAPARPRQTGIPAQALADRIDQFLASRGYRPPEGGGRLTDDLAEPRPAEPDKPTAAGDNQGPVDFVCEDDVRAAVRAGRKLVIGEKTIITPSARDLGDAQKVFIQAGWPQ
jgi:acetaldehyde dehydrogenase (acetylating)